MTSPTSISPEPPIGHGVNVHLYPSPLSHEMRMEKIARFIARQRMFARVELVGIREPGQPATETRGGFLLRRIARPQIGGPRILKKMVQTLGWSWSVFRTLRQEKIRCVNSHSLAVLPLGVLLKLWHGARLIYDTHELETEVATAKGMVRGLYKVLEWLFIRWADDVVVVGEGIADWYAKEYGIARPVVVRNVPELMGARPEPDRRLWRDRFGIPEDHLIFIYQGGLFRGRRIEQLLRVFAQAKPDRHIVFMGYGEMQAEVENAAKRFSCIHYSPAVKPDEVLRHTAGADVGLVGVENVCLSYYFSLPNKLFEFLLAGIPALMPQYPEMARLMQGSDCSWVVGERDEDWLAAVNALTPAQVQAGQQAARVAGAKLSWQDEVGKMGKLYFEHFGLVTAQASA